MVPQRMASPRVQSALSGAWQTALAPDLGRCRAVAGTTLAMGRGHQLLEDAARSRLLAFAAPPAQGPPLLLQRLHTGQPRPHPHPHQLVIDQSVFKPAVGVEGDT